MKTNRHLFFTLVIALAALLLGTFIPLGAVLSQGGTPQTGADSAVSPDTVDARPAPALTYQGNLKRGGAAYTGTCDFHFSLWEKASGGLQIGLTQNSTGVEVTDGLFTTLLVFGFDNDFIVGGENRFIQTDVKCPGDGDYTTLTPRQALRPAASALTLQPGATIIDRSLTTGVDALYVAQTTANSQAIHGKATDTGSIGVWGEGVNNTGVYGLSQGGTGVWGKSTSATGVYGESGSGTGVSGQSTGANTIAVKGVANAAGSVGVWGQSAANTGVYGQSGAAGGAALWGNNTAGGVALKAEGNA
ncbi:MAG TPA: hypothetical protein PL105_23540, partial [Caldilineaceae bacterium]|nr:hypothetical protein [Caldilineaceae bacterium]